MMSSQSFLIRKNGFKLINPKNFVKKLNINLILAKVGNQQSNQNTGEKGVVSNNKIKVSFYRFLKVLKHSKNGGSDFGKLGLKFNTNNLYTSFVEIEKTKKIKILREKIKTAKNSRVVVSFFQKPSFVMGPIKKRKNFSNLAKGLEKFENLYSDYSNTGAERQAFFKTLKAKRFFPSIFFSRLFLYAAKGKKKYQNTFFYVFKRRRKIDSLFHVYTLSSLKFKDVRKQRKKLYKRIVWKIKKQKKWRRRLRVSYTLFRLRQKLSQVFYVPKHFEINYKTFATNYLGFTDAKTTNTKIAFWLNLRKLLTFVT